MTYKNYILIFFIALTTNNLYSQNKTETADWIIRQLNLHKLEIHVSTRIAIRNDSIIAVNYEYDSYSRIAFKDIQTIKIAKNKINTKQFNEVYYDIILSRSDDKKMVEKGEKDKKGNLSKPKKENNYHEFHIILDEFLDENDIDKRLGKAFKKLVELNNGNAKIIEETF